MAEQNERLIAKRQAARAARERAVRETAQVPTARPVLTQSPTIPANTATSAAAVVLPQPQNGGAIALPMQDMSRVITSKDVKIPRLLMGQSMSKVVQEGDVKLGHWYHNAMNRDLGTEITAVLADYSKSRSFFEDGVGVRCRSFDLVQGIGDPGILCEGTVEEQSTLRETERGCPYRLWSELKKGPKNPAGAPECGENYTFALVIIEDPEDEDSRLLRALVTFRKTGIPAAKKIIGAKVEEEYDWTDMAVKMRINSKTNPRGQTFQIPEVTWIGDADEFPRAQARAVKLAGMVNSTVVRATLESESE